MSMWILFKLESLNSLIFCLVHETFTVSFLSLSVFVHWRLHHHLMLLPSTLTLTLPILDVSSELLVFKVWSHIGRWHIQMCMSSEKCFRRLPVFHLLLFMPCGFCLWMKLCSRLEYQMREYESPYFGFESLEFRVLYLLPIYMFVFEMDMFFGVSEWTTQKQEVIVLNVSCFFISFHILLIFFPFKLVATVFTLSCAISMSGVCLIILCHFCVSNVSMHF